MSDGEEDVTKCPVCWGTYGETGESVPRILPCSHSVCDSCLTNLVKENFVACPECRAVHMATAGDRTFPQNKYILAHMRKLTINGGSPTQKEEEPKFVKCEEHNQDISLYCKTAGCEKPICALCMIKHHKDHDVVGINEVKSKNLLKSIGSLGSKFQSYKANLVTIKEEMESKHRICEEKLIQKKEEQIKMLTNVYDNMIKDASNQMQKECEKLDANIAIIDENIQLLNSIKQNIDEETMHTDIKSREELVSNIAEQVREKLSQEAAYKYNEYVESEDQAEAVKKLFGRFQQNTLTMDIEKSTAQKQEAKQTKQEKQPKQDTRPKPKYEVVSTLRKPTWSNIFHISVLGENEIVVCHMSNYQWYMTKFDCNLGTPRDHVLQEKPDGMTDVRLCGVPCLALAYINRQEILFYKGTDLLQIIERRAVWMQFPGEMCSSASSSSSVLFFVDKARTESAVHRLDCSKRPPAAMQMHRTCTNQTHACEICVAKNGDTELLISTDGRTLYAYSTATGQLQWTASDGWGCTLMGVTADRKGRIYVSSPDKGSIQMYSTSGENLGCLIHGLSYPINVRWCDATSSLIVAHCQNDAWCLSVFKVNH